MPYELYLTYTTRDMWSPAANLILNLNFYGQHGQRDK